MNNKKKYEKKKEEEEEKKNSTQHSKWKKGCFEATQKYLFLFSAHSRTQTLT